MTRMLKISNILLTHKYTQHSYSETQCIYLYKLCVIVDSFIWPSKQWCGNVNQQHSGSHATSAKW